MARKVFLSFLGTSKYNPCNYVFHDGPKIENVNFIQEAYVRYFCGNWSKNDRIYICLTEDAKKRNWLDNDQNDRKGLKGILEALGFPPQIEEVFTPNGKNEKETWEIFQIVFRQLKEGDVLHLDITHGFRSLPMLAMIIINYAKVMKNIKIASISYGAFEAREKCPESGAETAPVFDLLPFAELQEWIVGVDRFLTTGSFKKIQELSKRKVTPILCRTKGKDNTAKKFKNLGDRLDDFSSTITTCRGQDISSSVKKLRTALDEIPDDSFMPPLHPLLNHLQTILESFKGDDEVVDGLAAARWCLEHDFYQQGYTILEETMITYILKAATGLEEKEDKLRSLVMSAVHIVQREIKPDQWAENAKKHPEHMHKLIGWFHANKALIDEMVELGRNRNDINHAGQRTQPKPLQHHDVRDRLKQHIEKIEAFFQIQETEEKHLK